MATAESGATLDPEGFAAELERWSRALARLDSSRAGVASLRDSLPAAWTIRAGDEYLDLSAGWLASALDSMASDPAHADSLRLRTRVHLEAMAREARAASDSPPRSDARARTLLDEIFRRPEFRSVRAPNGFDRLMERIQLWFYRLLEAIGRAIPRVSSVGDYLAWGVIVLVFALFALWLIRYLRRAAGEPRFEGQESAARVRGSSEWIEQARLLAGRGDYRGAVHCAYWAGVARLEELGSWAPDRARTPREYLRLLPPGHEHRSMLSALTQRFERIWYGFDPASPEDFSEAISHLEKMGCQLPWSPATAGS